MTTPNPPTEPMGEKWERDYDEKCRGSLRQNGKVKKDPQYYGYPGYGSPCWEKTKKLIAQSLQEAKAETSDKIKKSMELWFSTHDKSQKRFDSDDLIKYILEGL